jgi:hypothetical protein
VTNRTDAQAADQFELVDLPGGRLVCSDDPLTVAGGAAQTTACRVEAPAAAFAYGLRDAHLRVTDGKAFSAVVPVRLVGPFAAPHAAPPAPPAPAAATQGAAP